MDVKGAPPTPDEKTLQLFAVCFQDEASLLEAREGEPLILPSRICVRVSMSDHGQVAVQLQKVEEYIIVFIQPYIARFGLVKWAPDLHLMPYTLYNAVSDLLDVE